MTAQPLISLIDLNNQLDLDDVCSKFLMSKFFFEHTTLKSIHISNSYFIIFYHPKKLFYQLYHTILQYPQYPKTLLFYHFIKILFFNRPGGGRQTKKTFFFRPLSLFFFSFLPLSLSLFCLTSLLSGFDCAPVHAPVRSWVCAPVVDHGSWIVNL